MAASNYDDIEELGPGTAYKEPKAGFGFAVKTIIGAFALLGVAAIGWVAWIAYDEGVRTGAVKTVPVIRADAGEIKRKPDDPGGLVIPDQDKLVFNRLAPGQAEEPVERLLPLPEAPIVLPVKQTSDAEAEKSLGAPPASPPESEVATALTPNLVEPSPAQKLAEPPTVDPAEVIANTPTDAGSPLASPAVPAPVELAPAPPPPPPPPSAPTPEKAAAPPPPATPVPAADEAPQVAAGPVWRIQLASISNQNDAEAVWTRLKAANKDLLGGLQLRVETAKLKKGTFYRVQAGPLANRAAADSLCGTLKSRKQDCLVVAP